MRTIEEILGDLLLRHNCVIVPSFGGFVAKQTSAKIDYISGKMIPPSKSLLFNKQLINNDGLLINEFAVSNNFSFDDAARRVEGKVKEWNKALHAGHRIELDRIGHLYFDSEKNLCFEQDRFFNLLLASFGLEQVQFTPEAAIKKAEENPVVETELVVARANNPIILETEEKIEEIPSKEEAIVVPIKTLQPTRKKVWRYVAAACIIPIAFYSVWIPMKTDVLESGMISLNDFNPFHKQGVAGYQQKPLGLGEISKSETISLQEQVEVLDGNPDVYTFAYDDDTNVSVELPTEEGPVIESLPDDLSGTGDDVNTISANTMFFIVGCFSVEKNAVNLVSKLKAEGFDAKIVDVHNGLHRVSAGGAISMESLSNIKAGAQASGYNGWILK